MNSLPFVALMLASLLLAGCGAGKQRADERWIDTLRIKGVKSVPLDDLEEGLAQQQESWWSWTLFADKQWYDAALLDRDLQRIVAFYAARGYFEAKIVARAVRPAKRGEAVSIEITVAEGKPTHLEAVELVGLDRVAPGLRDEVRRALSIARGQRYGHGAFERAKQAMREVLVAAGYYYADVDGRVAVDRKRRQARAQLALEPGPLVHFGKTRFVGAGPIPRDKLHNLIAWREGEVYDEEQVGLTRARLYGLEVFSVAQPKLPEAPCDPADVTIKLSPSKLRELRIGFGFGIEPRRQEIRLPLRWTLRNFFGGLRTLTFRLRPAYVFIPAAWDLERHGPAVETDLKLVQPDIFGTAITAFGLTGYDVGVYEGYRYHGPRLGTGLDRLFFADLLRLGVSWNLQFLDFFDKNNAAFDPAKTPLAFDLPDPYRLAYLEQTAQLDLRDDPLDPRLGVLLAVRTEEGLVQVGGEFTYFKVTPELRAYLPIFTRRLVLAGRGLFGYISPASGEDSPVTRRYYFGGPTSHRGFSYGRLSPQSEVGSVPLGGDGALLLSADLRLRLFKLFNSWFSVGAFLDAGDVVYHVREIELDRLHVAVGGGLLYNTPIGAIRVAVGVRLNRLAERPENPDPGERVALHITIGEAF